MRTCPPSLINTLRCRLDSISRRLKPRKNDLGASPRLSTLGFPFSSFSLNDNDYQRKVLLTAETSLSSILMQEASPHEQGCTEPLSCPYRETANVCRGGLETRLEHLHLHSFRPHWPQPPHALEMSLYIAREVTGSRNNLEGSGTSYESSLRDTGFMCRKSVSVCSACIMPRPHERRDSSFLLLCHLVFLSSSIFIKTSFSD